MSKNLTRKGLAFGAVASLIVTAFSGAPAFAVGQDNGYVSLVPTSGTAYATLSSQAFDLKANSVGSISGTSDKNLKFFVTDPDKKLAVDVELGSAASLTEATVTTSATDGDHSKTGAVVTVTATAHGLLTGDAVHVTTAATTGLAVGYYTVTKLTDNTFSVTAADSTALDLTQDFVIKKGDADDLDSQALLAKNSAISSKSHFGTASVPATIAGTTLTSGRYSDGSFVIDTETNSNAADKILRLVNTDSTVSTTVTVTAWVDDNDNNVVDSTEYVSPTRTVKFLKNADLTVTSALDVPVIDDAAITGTVSISPELNGDQIATGTATVGVYGTATLQAGSATVSTTWNATNKNWDLSIADSDNVEIGSFTFRAKVAGTAIGNTASLLVSTRVAADTKLVSSATVDQQGFTNETAGIASTAYVRAAKTATLVATAYDSTGAALGAGKSVAVLLSSATTTTDWSINGTKVLDNAASATKYYTTDASGKVTLAISSTSGANNDAITIEVRPEGLVTTAAAKATLTWATATYALVDVNAPAATSSRTLNTNGSISFDIRAVDQWNGLLAGDYRLQMVASGRADGTTNVAFASGSATYTVADASLGSGSTITVATQLQKLTDGVWGNSTAATDLSDVTVNVSDAPTTSLIPAVTYTADTGADATADTAFDLWEKQIVAYDVNKSQASLVAPYLASTDDTASIALSAGAGFAVGDVVTVSGAGLWFAYLDGGVAGTGTIKALAENSITFVVDSTSDVIGVYSNKYVKDAVVTATTRGRSGTVKVSSHAAGADSGTTFVVTAPATIASGRTFTVSAILTDLFGNVVDATSGDISTSYTGPGFVSGNLPVDTDATGKLSFSVLLGSADHGVGTVTIKYDTNADGDVADLGEFTVSKSILVGVSAGARGDVKAVSSLVKNAAGATVKIVRGAKVATAVATSDSYRISLKGIKAGKRSVKVYVNDVLVKSGTVTVK